LRDGELEWRGVEDVAAVIGCQGKTLSIRGVVDAVRSADVRALSLCSFLDPSFVVYTALDEIWAQWSRPSQQASQDKVVCAVVESLENAFSYVSDQGSSLSSAWLIERLAKWTIEDVEQVNVKRMFLSRGSIFDPFDILEFVVIPVLKLACDPSELLDFRTSFSLSLAAACLPIDYSLRLVAEEDPMRAKQTKLKELWAIIAKLLDLRRLVLRESELETGLALFESLTHETGCTTSDLNLIPWSFRWKVWSLEIISNPQSESRDSTPSLPQFPPLKVSPIVQGFHWTLDFTMVCAITLQQPSKILDLGVPDAARDDTSDSDAPWLLAFAVHLIILSHREFLHIIDTLLPWICRSTGRPVGRYETLRWLLRVAVVLIIHYDRIAGLMCSCRPVPRDPLDNGARLASTNFLTILDRQPCNDDTFLEILGLTVENFFVPLHHYREKFHLAKSGADETFERLCLELSRRVMAGTKYTRAEIAAAVEPYGQALSPNLRSSLGCR